MVDAQRKPHNRKFLAFEHFYLPLFGSGVGARLFFDRARHFEVAPASWGFHNTHRRI